MLRCTKRKLDKIGATFALATSRSALKKKIVTVRKYYCTTCNAWHLTKKIKRS